MAIHLGLAAFQKGLSVGFTTAAALVREIMEARVDRQLLRLQKKLTNLKFLIIDELGFVPLSKAGAELLFEVFSQHYERGSIRRRKRAEHAGPWAGEPYGGRDGLHGRAARP